MESWFTLTQERVNPQLFFLTEPWITVSFVDLLQASYNVVIGGIYIF